MGGKDVSPNMKLGVLTILVVQNCSLILMMRYSRIAGDPNARYIISTAVVLSELLKMFTSLLVLYWGKLKAIMSISSGCAVLAHIIRTDFTANSVEMMKLAVPSGLYVVQNNLQYLSASNLPAPVFQVLSQLKIVTTAFFSVCMLSRSLSPQQWLSILCLSGGVGMVQISQTKPQSQSQSQQMSDSTDNYMLGVTCVLFSCLTSGFAGVYFEKVLKSGGGRISLWLRNVHMAMIGACLSMAVCYVQDYEEISRDGFFKGYDSIVWTVILLQAGGGLVVATVVMYADNVLKGFATSFSVVISCIISAMFLENKHLNSYFICGAVIVVASALMYSLFPIMTNKTNPPATQHLPGSVSASSASSSSASSESAVTGGGDKVYHDEEEALLMVVDEENRNRSNDSSDNNNDNKNVTSLQDMIPAVPVDGTVSVYVDNKNRGQASLEQRGSGSVKKNLTSPMTV